MAGGRTERRLTTHVLKSGGLYLLLRGDLARAAFPGREVWPAVPAGAAMAHLHVHEPWTEIVGDAGLPDAVTAARDGDDGWDAPEWAEG